MSLVQLPVLWVKLWHLQNRECLSIALLLFLITLLAVTTLTWYNDHLVALAIYYLIYLKETNTEKRNHGYWAFIKRFLALFIIKCLYRLNLMFRTSASSVLNVFATFTKLKPSFAKSRVSAANQHKFSTRQNLIERETVTGKWMNRLPYY